MEFIQPLAVLGMLLLGFGVMFRIVRPGTVVFFALFLFFIPTLLSTLIGGHLSWQAWLVITLVILIGLRIFIDRTFRKK